MQTVIYFKRVFFFVLVILLIHRSLMAVTEDSISSKKRFNIGVNISSLIHLPFLSVDFGLTPRLGLTVEAKPLLFPYKLSKAYKSDFIVSKRVWENYNLKGLRSSLILHWIKPDVNKKHFTPAIELAYSYQHRKNFYIEESNRITFDKIDGMNTEIKYYEVFSRSKVAVNFLINYGKEKFKIYMGVGIAGSVEYGRGYLYEQIAHIHDNSSSYSPFIGTDISFSPVFRIGTRFSILSL